MMYTKYIIENQNSFEEEELSYVSNALLKVILITENELKAFQKDRSALEIKYQCLKHIEKEIANSIYKNKDINREEKVLLMELLAKLNSQKDFFEILLSDNPEQRFLDLKATSECFAKKMQSSVE